MSIIVNLNPHSTWEFFLFKIPLQGETGINKKSTRLLDLDGFQEKI